MNIRQDLKFKPLALDDLKRIFNWFKLSEINKWYAKERDWSISDIENKYQPRLIGQEIVPSFIIKLGSKEIGFIQYYTFSKTSMPEGLSYDDAILLNVDIHTSVGMDLFIAEESLMGQNLGKIIIRDFIKKIIPKDYETIFIDPSKLNTRAIRAYQKVGFEEYSFQDNDNISLMFIKREDLDIKVVYHPDNNLYDACFAGCIILTHDKRILLQKRPENWQPYPGYLTTFGGRIEKGETPAQAIVRELYEELGAQVSVDELVELGAVTEPCTNHKELIVEYFWHDKDNLITACHEGIPVYFKDSEAIFVELKIMDDIEWVVNECQKKKLLPKIGFE